MMQENNNTKGNDVDATTTAQSKAADNAAASNAAADASAEIGGGKDGRGDTNDNVVDGKKDGGGTSETKEDAQESSDKKRAIEETKVDEEPLPTLPVKRARTAYFIFADEKREEVKQKVGALYSQDVYNNHLAPRNDFHFHWIQ